MGIYKVINNNSRPYVCVPLTAANTLNITSGDWVKIYSKGNSMIVTKTNKQTNKEKII